MRIVFWQNCLTPHQLPYIVHLIDDPRVDEVVLVAGETVSEARKKMGWNIESYEGLNNCKVYINPHNTIIESILLQRPNDSHHLFSGIRANAFVFKCLQMSMKYCLCRGMISERPNTYNFKWNINNGKPYWIHRLRFFIQDKHYAKYMKNVFAIGHEADKYFKSLGVGWNVHPFCYCTKSAPCISEAPITHTQQYIFVGSLSSWKNPLSIIHAFSNLKDDTVFKKWEIKFIGNGELRNKLYKEIEKNKFQKQIILLGTIPQQEIPSYLYKADVLILPSLYDGWGAVVNEALQAGCFVICSDACGACTLLKMNPNLGLIFKAGNDKALADCIKHVNTHIEEIRSNRTYRSKWAEIHISGNSVAKYFVDCLEKNLEVL